MIHNLYEKTMWESRRSIWWWIGGIAGLTMLMVGFYPSLEGMEGFADLLANYPEAFLAIFGLDDPSEFLTGAGFMSGELYSAMLPIMVLIFTIQRGAAATAGAEQDGTMDLTLSTPVSRRRVVVQKALALATSTALIGASLIAVLVVGSPIVDMGLRLEGIVAVNVGLVLFGLLFGALAMAVGAWTGRRALASGTAAGVAVLAFFVNGLAPLIEVLQTPEKFSPFGWLLDENPLSTGFDWSGLGLLAGTALALFAVAVWAFERRAIGT